VISARPGYWDMDRCSWVGVEPTYVVPPLRHADHAHERVVGAPLPRVPAPRHRRPEVDDRTEGLPDEVVLGTSRPTP